MVDLNEKNATELMLGSALLFYYLASHFPVKQAQLDYPRAVGWWLFQVKSDKQ